MIQLIASAPDGWAIACTEEGAWLFRPPYRVRDLTRMTDREVGRALADGDFAPDDWGFPNWGSLCDYLEARCGAATPEEREAAPDAAAALLARATVAQARRHLAETRRALATAEPDRVDAVLFALLRSPAVQGDQTLVDEIETLRLRVETKP